MYAKFEVFRTFLLVFMSGFWIFERQELWVNVPVAIFFGTVDYSCPGNSARCRVLISRSVVFAGHWISIEREILS